MPRRLTAALAASLLAVSVHAQTRAGGEFRLTTSTTSISPDRPLPWPSGAWPDGRLPDHDLRSHPRL